VPAAIRTVDSEMVRQQMGWLLIALSPESAVYSKSTDGRERGKMFPYHEERKEHGAWTRPQNDLGM
jgi:hypothetical protein